MPDGLAGHSFTRPEGLVLCLSLILRVDEGGLAGAGAKRLIVTY